MEFTIDKQKFLDFLSLVKPTLPNKATKEVLKNFNIRTEDNDLIVRAVNQSVGFEIEVRLSNIAEVKKQGECNVSPLLFDLLSLRQPGNVKITLVKNRVEVTQGKSKNSVATIVGEFPDKQYVDGYEEVSPALLSANFSKLNNCLSQLADRPVLQAYNINPHHGYILASDSFRIAMIKGEPYPGHIAKPHGNAINAISKALSDLGENSKFEAVFGQMSSFKGYHYKDDECYLSWTFNFASMQPDYPDAPYDLLKSAVEKEASIVKINKKRLVDILKVCKLYSDTASGQSKPSQLELIFKQGEVEFVMDIKGIGQVDEVLEYEEGNLFQEIPISLSPSMLLDEVSGVISDKVSVKLFEPEADKFKPIVILDEEFEEWAYIQAPMMKMDD